ncbi:hypothetical protein FNV43_RR19869 [Rhamnella rubrinervis]|uniref:Pentatricopeptide repeat-containing protein n=1 Tax=Rhamnella rubrinervis TaxID=2594499 RepID=A0A8K0DYN0_9ROSA|nr:hypothetical protein FNV43_RR19869 [Rhamnella rubrinervis]
MVQSKHIFSPLRLLLNNKSVPKTAINLSVLKSSLLRCQVLKEFKQILSQMILNGLIKNKFAAKTLLKFSTGSLASIDLSYSFKIFNLIDNPDASIYNIMIIAYLRRNYPHRAIHFFKLMLSRNVRPKVYTYPFLIEACAIRLSWHEWPFKPERPFKIEGPQMHSHAVKLGFDSDVHVRSTLIDMYADSDEGFDALNVFEEGPMMSSFVWYSLLYTCSVMGRMKKAEYFYNLMPEKDAITSSFMIVQFMRCGMWEEADKLISDIPENDTAHWSEIIYGFCAPGLDMYEHAFNVFIEMHGDGMTIDELVVEAVLHCCRKSIFIPDCMEMGKLTHCLVMKIGIESDVELQNGLIGMYSVYGERLYAQNLFYAACWLHQSSWSFVIRMYLRYDLFKNAREMLHSGIRPGKMSLDRIITDLAIDFAAWDLRNCVYSYSIKNGYNVRMLMQGAR